MGRRYHPGTLARSKAGGVWWTCCGAVGLDQTLLDSRPPAAGPGAGARSWKWGCKRSKDHVALQMFDHTV